jgi:A/G-specific adenine glycosylase
VRLPADPLADLPAAGDPSAGDPLAVVPPALRGALLAWYAANGRDLAFRATRDPYAVLVSELMAQQTQAARAAEAWTAWMARFPTVTALASSSVADVLRAWAGLGYNRRAVSLHRAAQMIVAEHGGRVPDTVEGLALLPGVGPYTARAVAAIAFGRQFGAVDTNVRRVLGRVAAGDGEALTPAAIQALADAIVPDGRAGDWTHALMDLGATLCRPRSPRCGHCPARAWCRYAAGQRSSATARARPARQGRPEPPFPTTSRWLRGRILGRAREARDGEWVAFGDPMGVHPEAVVRDAVLALGREGLLDIDRGSIPLRARLPAPAQPAPAQPAPAKSSRAGA